jgi:hypothetical protein
MSGWKEPFIYCADFLPLAAGSGNAYTSFELKIANNADFELIRSIHQATSDSVNLRIFNATTGRDILRTQGDIRAISSKAFSGITANGFVPYTWPIPYYVPAGTELNIFAADSSGSDNNFRLAFHGNNIYTEDAPYEKRKSRESYAFSMASGSLSAYSTVTKTLMVDTNAGYLISKLTGISTGTCTIYIQDKRPWSTRDVHMYNMIGNSQFGNNLTSRRWIPEKTMLSVRFTDISGSTNNISISFQGERVYV